MSFSPPIQAASLGMADSIILMILALVVFGPRRLPQIGRQIGKLMYEFRKASNDFKWQMEEELRKAEAADRQREEAERQKSVEEAQKAAELAQSAAESALNAAAEIKAATEALQIEAHPAEAAPASLTDGATPLGAPSETALTIKPPSTGEQIAASRPGRPASEPVAEALAGAAELETSSVQPPATEEHPAPESAAHHG